MRLRIRSCRVVGEVTTARPGLTALGYIRRLALSLRCLKAVWSIPLRKGRISGAFRLAAEQFGMFGRS